MTPENKIKANHYAGILSLFILAVAAVMLAYLIIGLNKTNYKVQETSAYTRASNCIAARLATSLLSQKEVEDCYIQVEKNTNIKLERFDLQTKPSIVQ